MKLYLSIIGLIALNVGIWGFALPFLISAASTFSVLAGVVLMAILLPIDYKWIMKIVSDVVSKLEKKEN